MLHMRAQATHRRRSSAFETRQLEPLRIPARRKTYRSTEQGLYWPTFGNQWSKRPANGRCQGSLKPPREIPVYEILDLQDVFPVYSDQLPANVRL